MSRTGEVAPGCQLTAPADRTAPRAGLVRAWQRLFTLSESEALFTIRGFVASDLELRNHLEAIGTTFISGYNLGLTEPAPGPLREALESLPPARRGFLVEGAAMGAAIADGITPWQSRLPVLLSRYRDSEPLAGSVVALPRLLHLPVARRHRLGAGADAVAGPRRPALARPGAPLANL